MIDGTGEEFEHVFTLQQVLQTPVKKARRCTQSAVADGAPAGDDDLASNCDGTDAESDTCSGG